MGSKGPDLAGLSDMFYKYEGYDILPMRHTYTKTKSQVLTAYFIPSYRILSTKMDHRGYTSETDGKAHYDLQRAKFKNDPEGYLIHCAEYCYYPEDALVLESENLFNKVLLSDLIVRIKEFKEGPKIEHGTLEYDFKDKAQAEENITGIRFIPSDRGKVHIIERPIKDESGSTFKNLYVAGIDAIDLGGNETSAQTKDPSSFCVTIKRKALGTLPPMYVAYYKDRPQNINDAYRTALKLLEYYNCKALLENTKITFKTFLEGKGKARKYLMRRPRVTLQDLRSAGNTYGVPATEAIIQHQLDLITQYIEDYSTEIWFPDMLEELLQYQYKNKRRFDIVASLGMCELADEEMLGFVPVVEETVRNEFTVFGFYTDPKTGYKKYGSILNNLRKAPIAHLGVERGTGYYRTSDPRKLNYV